MNKNKSVPETDLQLGDVAQVRPGFTDPDTKTDMSGWCGRVTEFYPEEGTALIAFDSQTLKAMPAKYIKRREREGFSMNFQPAALVKNTRERIGTWGNFGNAFFSFVFL